MFAPLPLKDSNCYFPQDNEPFLVFLLQSHTSCCSDALCPTQNHKGDSLGPSGTSVYHVASTHHHALIAMSADYAGPGEGLLHLWTVIMEWLVLKEKTMTHLFGEKTSACVKSNTTFARNLQFSLNCPFWLNLSILWTCLDFSSFLEQLL